ncbi:MAG: hypothetical protein Q7T46_11660 [Polaromonas sp.]|nr:hypothetical protein [Polaromonas sp.]
MSHSLKAQRAEQKRQPVEYNDDDATASLWQCINSGQVEAAQLVQHYYAGEIQTNQGASDGRNTEN